MHIDTHFPGLPREGWGAPAIRRHPKPACGRRHAGHRARPQGPWPGRGESRQRPVGPGGSQVVGGRGPCQSHRPAGGRRGASLGRGPGAGGSGSGRRRASDRQPWRMLSWSANGGSERGSHLPRVTQQGEVGGLAFHANSSDSKAAEPSAAGAEAGTRLGSRSPKTLRPLQATLGWSCRIPERSVHTASPAIRQPLSSQAVQARSQSRQGLKWSQELNKPWDAGLETSPGFWAGSLYL